MALITRILAILLVLGVTLAAPASAAASLLQHEDCHGCVEHSHHDGDHGAGGEQDCPCACHIHLAPAISAVPFPVSGPSVILLDRLMVSDPLPVEGLPPGIDHPPQNA